MRFTKTIMRFTKPKQTVPSFFVFLSVHTLPSQRPLSQSFTARTSLCLSPKSTPIHNSRQKPTNQFRFFHKLKLIESAKPAMDTLSSVSSSMVLPPRNLFRPQSRRLVHVSRIRYSRFPRLGSISLNPSRRRLKEVSCKLGSEGDVRGEDDDGSEEVERALHMDGTIPGTSNEFVRQVSSRAYDMRRHLQQSFDSSSYDVLDANPWRENSKPVYVLTQKENQLCTMKTRRNRREVEKELGLLFSKGGNWRSGIGNKSKQARGGTKFQMLVEDVREGVLVFEDENEAVKYCDLMQGGEQNCEGVAEIEASSIFDLCQKMRALAVLFRRGRTPPQPENLKLNLRARKRSLEDQDDLI